jgi:hypothetical protein
MTITMITLKATPQQPKTTRVCTSRYNMCTKLTRVDDDLATGEASVAVRAADNEAA